MLHYAVVFLVIALIAGVLAFGGIAGESEDIAKLLFYGFSLLSAASFAIGLLRKSQPSVHPRQERNPT